MFVSGRVFHNSLFHLCARHFTRNDLNHAYQQFLLVFLVLSPLYMVTEQDMRNLSLSVTSKSSGVWSSPKSASHITALFVFRPSSRAPSHLSSLTRAQERGDTSLSSFDGRTPRASPSRTPGQGFFPPQPFNSPSSRTSYQPTPFLSPQEYDGSARALASIG